ncbi:high affinity methionine permease [Penicillium brasilianum]|uniref:High affinity methionine permease n=1 Tax=Penicillium brasilianum TaxID=104259 RepID=A0A1S9RMT3_PENBI|nr:high affinity methionine permease [Penicillium brasilianum]
MSFDDKEKTASAVAQSASGDEYAVREGSTEYTAAEGLNSSIVTYQDASGAPVETESPLGYSVDVLVGICLNVNQMIGTGIFSTPAAILKGVGSVGLSMVYWFIGYLIAQCSQVLYLEFLSYFPSRSGSEVVYLEQAYLKPKYFFPTVYAMKHVIFAFGSSNAVVLAQYLFAIGGRSYTNWQVKGVAVAAYTVAVIVVASNTKWSLRVVVVFGIIKLLTLLLISIAGFVVLGGHTQVADPMENWRNAWEGTETASAYGATNAMIKLVFSYAGYQNVFSLANEMKNPVKRLRWSAPLSLIVVAILYILVNVAYFSASTREEILASKQIAASIFFQKVFGTSKAARALSVLIVISSFGNLVASMIATSRMLRETGRQGLLPWPKYWTSTKPLGTPIGPLLVQWTITVIMIIGPPAGDAFNFIVDLAVYPGQIFYLLIAIGLILIRRRRNALNLPRPEFRAWNIALGFTILVDVYMLIAPWYPPTGGANGGDVSFWYGTYLAVGAGLLALCGIYYYFWIYVIPKWKGYQYRQTIVKYDDGAVTHKMVRVPKADLVSWDERHDAAGRLRHGVAR